MKMNTSLQISSTVSKTTRWFGLAGNLWAFSNVALFLTQCLRYFRFCSGKRILPWCIGILSFLLLLPSSAVPGLVELAGWSVSAHCQLLTPIYSSLASSLSHSTNIQVPSAHQAWLSIPGKRENNTVLASLCPGLWADSSPLLCLHFLQFTVCFLFWLLTVPLQVLPGNYSRLEAQDVCFNALLKWPRSL